MDINEYFDLLLEYSLNNENYLKWRETHGKAFGDVFLSAFKESAEAQIHLTAALIKISNRDFDGGLPRLLMLKEFCFDDFDCFVLTYFIGLCYEFLENEEQMSKYYDKMLTYDFDFRFITAFHPYYRTAKFAQRKSENEKALYYYNKALELYLDKYTNINGDTVEISLYKEVDCFKCNEEDDGIQEIYSGFMKLDDTSLKLITTYCCSDELRILQHE